MKKRGYSCIALHQPKSPENVGGAMRACGVYGTAMIVIAGSRFKHYKNHPTDTMKAWKHVPVLEAENALDLLPHDCVPVGVEIVEGARELPEYTHPERAMYIFGPEDGSVPRHVLEKCRDVVVIPTSRCMNLAATVNVVLYDRMCKRR